MAGVSMKFDSLTAFFQMDGQGLYVWAAYGITCIFLVLNLWMPALRQWRWVSRFKHALPPIQEAPAETPVKAPADTLTNKRPA